MTKTTYIAVGASAASLALGFFAGYLTARNRLEEFYDKRASREIGEANRYFRDLHKKSSEIPAEDGEKEAGEEEAPSIHLDGAVDALVTYQGRTPEQKLFYHGITPPSPTTVPPAVVGNEGIRTQVDPRVEIDAQAIEEARLAAHFDEKEQNPDKPYVISDTAFMLNEPQHDQSTLTYYEGDRVLAYENDEVVDSDQIEPMVGADNLTKFGTLSGDDQVVLIRNEKLMLDFEITRNDGKYITQVLGLDGGETG